MSGTVAKLKMLSELISRRGKINLIFLGFVMVVFSCLELMTISSIPTLVLAITFPEKLLALPVLGIFLTTIYQDYGENFALIISMFVVALVFTKSGFLVYLSYLQGSIGRRFQIQLSTRLLLTYLHVPYRFHMSANVSELMRNINGEVGKITNQVLIRLMVLASKLLMAVAIIALMIITEPWVSILSMLLFVFVNYLLLNKMRRKISDNAAMALDMRKVKNKVFMAAMAIVKEIKLFNNQETFQKLYRKAIRKEAQVFVYKSVVEKIPRAVLEVVAMVTLVTIIYVFNTLGRDPEQIVGILVLFSVALLRLLPISNLISTSLVNIIDGLESVKPVYDDISLQHEVLGEGKRKFNLGGSSIQLKGVSFSYDDKKNALNKIDLSLKIGASIGIVGPSGSGKSTLVDIIMGLIPPGPGNVFCEGVDVWDSIGEWRRHFGYVPQRISLVNDNILNNICLGLEENQIDQQRLQEVIDQVQLREWVDTLDEGFYTQVGERGIKTSGGQQQRIGIARALYHKPDIVVFDEATAALDNITEKLIVKEIEGLKGTVTTITIAHRLTTVKNCDIIYYLEGGQITHQGSFEELMLESEEFRRMNEVTYE